MRLLREISSKRFRVVEEKRVNEAKELHDSFVLSQILVALQQELILLAVITCVVSNNKIL